jgi:hypothetical protein
MIIEIVLAFIAAIHVLAVSGHEFKFAFRAHPIIGASDINRHI